MIRRDFLGREGGKVRHFKICLKPLVVDILRFHQENSLPGWLPDFTHNSLFEVTRREIFFV